jgi:hypothetical protein
MAGKGAGQTSAQTLVYNSGIYHAFDSSSGSFIKHLAAFNTFLI